MFQFDSRPPNDGFALQLQHHHFADLIFSGVESAADLVFGEAHLARDLGEGLAEDDAAMQDLARFGGEGLD